MSFKSITWEDVRSLVSSRIFQRGEDYYEMGTVSDFSADENKITAMVEGTDDYSVEIKEVDGDLTAECSCPFGGEICKHVVAVLLWQVDGEPPDEEAMESNLPKALKQTLESLPHDELLKLILQMAEREDVRKVLLNTVKIAPHVLKYQSRDRQKVKQLKRDIDQFFRHFNDYGDYDDEADYYPELDEAFEAARALHPADLIEVVWHGFQETEAIYSEYCLGTGSLETGLEYYAEALVNLNLSHEEKQTYFDQLMGLWTWEMSDYGSLDEKVEQALEKIAEHEGDYQYLIEKLEDIEYKRAADLKARFHLKLGEEDKYLKVRQDNLQTEAQYQELADYWLNKGDQQKYLDTLEEWVKQFIKQKSESDKYFSSFISSSRDTDILDNLAKYYEEQQDWQNLYRIFMTRAKYRYMDFDLYKRIKEIANKLGIWSEVQEQVTKLAYDETLAKIYIEEQEWKLALKLAQSKESYESVKSYLAEQLKNRYPQEIVAMYEKLVDKHLEGRSRKYYQYAAAVGKKIKDIYVNILDDKSGWQKYIDSLRGQHYRKTALIDELRKL